MGYPELMEKIRALPEDKQAEVFDFVEFLANRFAAAATGGRHDAKGWSEAEFSAFSMGVALSGMEDDPVTYTRGDLRESWR